MSKCDIQVKFNTKTKHWNNAILGLKKYGENLDAIHGKPIIRDKSLILFMPKCKSGTFSG